MKLILGIGDYPCTNSFHYPWVELSVVLEENALSVNDFAWHWVVEAFYAVDVNNMLLSPNEWDRVFFLRTLASFLPPLEILKNLEEGSFCLIEVPCAITLKMPLVP